MEAEKLLGGYATGTLSEAERLILFAAALERQDLFDALMGEEALRELLSDPAAKDQLLATLSLAAPPKIVPFWRRPGLIGAAAGLMVAATAGLAYLHSPGPVPPSPRQEAAKPPPAGAALAPPTSQAPKTMAGKNASAAPPKATARPSSVREAPVPSAPASAPQRFVAPSATGASASAMEGAARMSVQAESGRAEAQDKVARKAEVPEPIGTASREVVGSVAPIPPAAKAKARTNAPGRPDAPTIHSAPTWILVPQSDGSTRVTITAHRGPQVVLLRRTATVIEVLKVQAVGDRGSPLVQWYAEARLATGDVLDLYLLNAPVTDPSLLPETGPVDGFRARIHPAGKTDPAP